MDGCIPKEFGPIFQFKDITLTYPDQVSLLLIVEAPLFFAPFFFYIVFNTW